MTATAPALDGQSDTFILRNRMAGIAVLDIQDNDFELLMVQLRQRLQLAPDLFLNAPLALQWQQVPSAAELAQLCVDLRTLQLVPVAVTQASAEAAELASTAGLGLLTLQAPKQPAATASARPVAVATKVVKQPVRSGQQVVSEGDLIVLGQVGAGAEVIAKGNIHIYGALRGRAFAGAQGDENCHIFCRQLEAELVAVAGVFKVSDELDEPLRGKAAHVQLCDDQLHISAQD